MSAVQRDLSVMHNKNSSHQENYKMSSHNIIFS